MTDVGYHETIGNCNVRRRLPNRREHEIRDFEFNGIRYVAGIGTFPDGSIAEVFLNPAGRVGTDLEAHARDAAIPKPRRIGERKIWDVRELDVAFDALPYENTPTSSSWEDA
jgi:hypothetical protein